MKDLTLRLRVSEEGPRDRTWWVSMSLTLSGLRCVEFPLQYRRLQYRLQVITGGGSAWGQSFHAADAGSSIDLTRGLIDILKETMTPN